MTAVVASIANTVCPHHISETQSHSNSGQYEHFNWKSNEDGSVNAPAPNSAFCKYDCKTGHYSENNDGKCFACTTSCSPGYELTGACSGTTDAQCTKDADYCPATVDMPGTSALTGTRTYGHTEAVTCAAGYTAVGSPSVSCGADGAWIQSGKCIISSGSGTGQWQTSRVVVSNTCAASITASCPSGFVAVGGGMKNNGIASAVKSVYGESYPLGNSQWACQLGNLNGLGDCGNVACQVSCVPAASTTVVTVEVEYEPNVHKMSGGLNVQHGAGDTNFAQDGTVRATCPSGYTVVGVGMANNAWAFGFTDRNHFEEVSYDGNGAKCRMGKEGTESEFICYAKCAKATTGAYDCQTINSDAGRKHTTSCPRAHDQVVGGGMKSTLTSGTSFWNEITLSESNVKCQTGTPIGWAKSIGESICQARCCHVTA